MNKVLIVLGHEFRQTARSKVFIMTTIGVPLLLALGYGLYEGVQHWTQSDEPGPTAIAHVGYVDLDGRFDGYTTQGTTVFIEYEDTEAAKDDLLSGDIEEYFVVPEDYVTSGMVYRYTTERELELPGNVWQRTKDFLLSNLLAGEVEPEIEVRAKYPVSINTTVLSGTGGTAEGQDEPSQIILPIAFGVLFIFSLFFSSGSLMESVTEEKENRIMEILLSSVSSRQLFVGKVLGLGATGLLQMAVWLASIKVFTMVVSVNIPFLNGLSISLGLLGLAVVYFVLGYLLFAAAYSGLGSIVPSAKEAQGFSFLVTMPALVPLWFSALILMDPDGGFARAITFIPMTTPVVSVMRLSVHAMPTWEIALSLVWLVVWVVVAIWIAAKIFRTYLLMYGKRPGVRELVRSLRAA
jgi:ABC-2 type transport system permease protein